MRECFVIAIVEGKRGSLGILVSVYLWCPIGGLGRY